MKQLLLMLLAFCTLAIGYAQDFTVRKCTVDITIIEEGYFDVVEQYDINFDIPKHGIFRDIQTKYDVSTEQGFKEIRNIKISNVEVPGHTFDKPWDVTQKLSDTYQIKIGDADKTILGPQHYEIRYRVTNAFLYETDGVKFYWNLKSDGWWATFESIEFRIHLPAAIALDASDVRLYSGVSGTNMISQEMDVSVANGVVEGSTRPFFKSYQGQSVTILINLPPNSIAEIKPVWPFWTDYGWVLIVLPLLAWFYRTWLVYGKDDKVVTTTSYYPPNGMDPAMAGYLIDDAQDRYDLISLIPYWGSKGLLRIEELPKQSWYKIADTKLIALKPLPADAPNYEKTIFSGLFGDHVHVSPREVYISSLRNTFYTNMASAGTSLKALAQPYYEAGSKRVRNITYGVIIGLTLLLAPLFLLVWGFIAMFGLLLLSFILMILNIFMIKKNAKGNAVLSELRGFKQFIKVAEVHKLKMLIAENPSYFETTMSYALAFGLFKDWAGKFDAMNIAPPSWYSSTHGALSMHHFATTFSSTMSSTSSTMVSSPSSSGGGGSSGGGFGGGGGGSW